LASIKKDLQQEKDNATLARYINANRRKEGARKKAKEETQRKAMVMAPTSDEGQSSKDVRT
jgi:hypothetical protein